MLCLLAWQTRRPAVGSRLPLAPCLRTSRPLDAREDSRRYGALAARSAAEVGIPATLG